MSKSERRIWIVTGVMVLLIAGFGYSAAAKIEALKQTLTAVVTPNTPFRVQWDYPSDPAGINFSLWDLDSIIKNYSTSELTITKNASGTWTIEAPVPGLPAGQHSLQVSAWAPDPADPAKRVDVKSASVPLTSTNAPVAPVNLRIVVNVKGGGQ